MDESPEHTAEAPAEAPGFVCPDCGCAIGPEHTVFRRPAEAVHTIRLAQFNRPHALARALIAAACHEGPLPPPLPADELLE